MAHQPFLHDLVVTLAAPMQAWSTRDGQMPVPGAPGVYVGDRRVLAGVELSVADSAGEVELAPLVTDWRGGGTASFTSMVRVASDGADPLVSLTRTRVTTSGGVREDLVVSSALDRPVELAVTVRFRPDATPLNLIKGGVARSDAPLRTGLVWSWGEGTCAELVLPGAEVVDADGIVIATWRVSVAPNVTETACWSLKASDATVPFVAFEGDPLPTPTLIGGPPSLARLVQRSVADLSALRLAERGRPGTGFVAAGAPWFLTLFGRDSLLAARLFLPVSCRLALDTLRVLADRQGRVVDVGRAEAPGKILHEVRGAALDLHQGTVLPPEYYGTIDATPLWICLLGQAWRAGAPDAEVAGFLDPLLGALGWLRDHADPDGDGFLEYFDHSGHGLANQGWKDSGDSIRFADGRVAEGPIALAEVQGYAHQAARTGAELLRRFGRDDAEHAAAAEWDAWADAMASRFRERFWVSDTDGRYPALALDGNKVPVDAVASNMGHLLATGILSNEEERLVVDRLVDRRMFSGYGVRTVSSDNGAYWPTRYHGGSVWTHDTTMAIEGMLARGFAAEARVLAEGLLRAAEGFGDQLPELFGGQDAAELFPPAPYPASCHPQAWAAASAVTMARALGALA